MKPRVSQLAQSGATTGQALVWNGTDWAPAAVTDAGAIPKTLVDAKGDLLTATADNTPARLAVGSDGQALLADSTQTAGLRWGTVFTDPSTTKGDLLARTASALARLAVGTDGQVLTADSASTPGVKWANPAGGYTDPLTTKGDLVGRSSSATSRLAVGADGYVLTADSTQTLGVKWAAASSGSTSPFTVTSKTANYTAAAGECVLCSTSGGAFTVTLPASPSAGSMVAIIKTSTDTNFLTISGTIGSVSQVTLQNNTDALTVIYTGSKWEAQAQVGTSYVTTPPLSVITSGTYGDTFDGASLNARWTRVGYTSGDEVYQQGAQASEMTVTGRAAGNYYYQSAPAGDFDLVWAGEILATGSLMFGPIIADATGFGVGAGFYNGSPNGPIVGTITGWSYDSGSNASPSPLVPTGSNAYGGTLKVWIRLRKVGTTYSVATSTNGKTWNGASSTISRTFTPARIGFGAWFSSGLSSFNVDVFDVR